MLYKEEEIIEQLAFYNDLGFDCVPIQKNSKIPIEKDWTNKEHKNIDEWRKWLMEYDLNLGCKTGKCSDITVIDFDGKKISDEIQKMLNDTLIQNTPKGIHYFYKYESDLSKTSFDYDECHIDIENDGGQVVISPSIVENQPRNFIENKEPSVMPVKLKEFFLKHCKNIPKSENAAFTEHPLGSFDLDKFDLSTIQAGNRNNFIVGFGGILRKELNMQQTETVLSLINRHFCKPPLYYKEFNSIVKSLEKYTTTDQHGLAQKILNYLRIVEEATARDVKEITFEKKELVDKSLAYLVKEGYIIKHRGLYKIIKKADWNDVISDCIDVEIPFKMPYFHESAVLNWGDMILLGSKSKWGKTIISINIIKDLVKQGYKVHYISLETGSRFKKRALKLGLSDGDFYWAFEAHPTDIELEPGITIIDWLLIEDKAQTDVILKHFTEQLFKTNGFLIIFMQLKMNGEWFAPNMVEFFPSLCARYLYEEKTEDKEYGTYGKWIVEPIREPKLRIKSSIIPCVYNWDTLELKVVKSE